MEAPLHPETVDLAARHPRPRAALRQAWSSRVPSASALAESAFGEMPLIASSALVAQLDERLTGVLSGLAPHLVPAPDSRWPGLPRPDVLAIDFAIAHAPGGWSLRLVEFQAFTSALATAFLLSRAHATLWPILAARPFHGPLPPDDEIHAAMGRILAPAGTGIVLEHRPRRQRTRFDIEATAHLWNLQVANPRCLRRRGDTLLVRRHRRWAQVEHIVNRLIPHQVPNPRAVSALLAGCSTSWHSHPAWFYRVDKGLLPEIPLPAAERCARADQWESLGLAPEDLVLKACHSFGGRDVHIGTTAAALRALHSPSGWLVQPRYAPYPLLMARDGVPLFGEIRCMVGLPSLGHPWLMARVVRLSRGAKVSMGTVKGLPGEGATLLYAPPACP